MAIVVGGVASCWKRLVVSPIEFRGGHTEVLMYLPAIMEVCVWAGGVTVEAVMSVEDIPIQEHAEAYRMLPLHGEAYAGIVPGVFTGVGKGAGSGDPKIE